MNKREIKNKAVKYAERNNLDVAYFMTLINAAYELGWKEKAKQVLKAMKDFNPQ